MYGVMVVCNEYEPSWGNPEYKKKIIQDKLNNMHRTSVQLFRHFLEFTEDWEEWGKKNPYCSGGELTINELSKFWNICIPYHSENSKLIADNYGWIFDIKQCDFEKLEKLCLKADVPDFLLQENDCYKGLKEELFFLFFSPKAQAEIGEWIIENWNFIFVNCFVGIFRREYELWKIDRINIQDTFRNIEKLFLEYIEIRKNFATDVRFWHYFFLFQFGHYYCFADKNNLIDFAVYKFGYEKLREQIKCKEDLDTYLEQHTSKRKPKNLSPNTGRKSKKSFEDFVVNKAKSEEIFLLLNEIIAKEKIIVFVKTVLDYCESKEMDVKKRELASFWNSFTQKKGRIPCSYEMIRKCWVDLNSK